MRHGNHQKSIQQKNVRLGSSGRDSTGFTSPSLNLFFAGRIYWLRSFPLGSTGGGGADDGVEMSHEINVAMSMMAN